MTETPSPQQAYISKVHLKGYKSIRDLEIDFKPGLNIIIGPNGSGKTNFLQYLYSLNTSEGIYDELIPHQFEAKFDFKKEQISCRNIITGGFEIDKKGEFKHIIKRLYFEENVLKEEYHISKSNKKKKAEEFFLTEYSEMQYFFTEFIHFGNPIANLFNNPLEVQILKEHVYYRNISNSFDDYGGFLDFIGFKVVENDKIDTWGDVLIINLQAWKQLNKISPIKDIRIDNSKLRTYIDENGYRIVENIYLQFLVNEKWLNWSQLSDGTKRIFYIVFSFYYENTDLVFLEEPELGIHPDQLHKLMDFLIEQSKEKQIIITTHSPEVLNAIHPDELDRIIVTRYDADKGTIMHKLTPEQAKEMGERVKEGDMFLSDRWVHLNLEDEIFNATKLNEK